MSRGQKRQPQLTPDCQLCAKCTVKNGAISVYGGPIFGTIPHMRIAVLPFNAAEGTKPALGRQFSAFAAEQLRVHAGADINSVSFLTQIPEDSGETRMAFVNISDSLLPYEQLKELFDQAEVGVVQDGFLKQEGDTFNLTVRFFGKESEEPIYQEEIVFGKDGVFATLHKLVKLLANQAELGLPEFLAGETMEFGTDNADAFLDFLEGYDALNYIQQANGMVAREFSPDGAIDALLASVEADKDFEGPYQVLVQLCRACAAYRIGSFEKVDGALKKLTELIPDDFAAYFGLGEVYQAVGDQAKSGEYYEKAVALNPEDPALYTRLGMTQMQTGMPVNAERNFRKALELEGDDKPSADYLAGVLQQTGRGHEVPPIYKSMIDADAQNGAAHAKYAIALIQAGNEPAGEKAFEAALEVLEDSTVVKRHYAPYLVQKQEFDRAMDFYEDVLDAAPTEVPVLLEYAQTLEAAGREFEVPNVLKQVLQANPDPNTRANVLARLIELEQPKRAENVQAAEAKMQNGDFEGAIRDLKPLRNWLADYWKMWFLLAAAQNQTGQHTDAEESANRCLAIFPGCEPAVVELANALAGQDKLDDAYQLMRYAAMNNSSSLPLHLNLGLMAKRAGHSDEAKAMAKQIREALGGDAEAMQNIGPILDDMES